MRADQRKVLIELLSLPTAPFHEHHVLDYIRQWALARPGIRLAADEFGNLRLQLRRGPKRTARPLVFSAHTDHPGFEAGRMIGRRLLRAIWRGGVAPAYFRGAKVRFFHQGRWIRGNVKSVELVRERGRKRVGWATIRVPQPVPAGAVGMWDLPDPIVRGTRIHARGCDDVAGVAAVLAALDELRRRRGPIDVYALFTRAEEVGFGGAIAACRSGLLPGNARVVAVECSSEVPGVRMGAGPILRVGDRTCVFTPGLTAFCRRVAEDLAKRDRRFAFQRELMDGGTCESAAFCEFGYQATSLCIALGNYHNMNVERRRIDTEYVDLNDFAGLVKLFVALAGSKRPCGPGDPPFRKILAGLERRWSPLLKRTDHHALRIVAPIDAPASR